MFNLGRHYAEISTTVNPQETLLANDLQRTRSRIPIPVNLPLNRPSGSGYGDTVSVPTETAQGSRGASVHMGNSIDPL